MSIDKSEISKELMAVIKEMPTEAKALRKQLRNVVQEILPTLLASELGQSLHKDLSQVIQTRLNVVIKNIQETLEQIDQRSKDIQSYIVRQSLNPSPAQTAVVTSGANVNEQTKQQAVQGTESTSS